MKSDQSMPVADPRFTLRQEYPDAALLFDPDTGEQYRMNGVGARVWRLLNGRRSLQEIADRLKVFYQSVPEQAGRHVGDFIHHLVREGLVFQYPEPGTSSGADLVDELPAEPRDPALMLAPRSVDVAVTSRCNLRCSYCSHFTSAGDVETDVPLSEWRVFFRELRDAAVMAVTLQGGEPFCRGDLKPLIQGIVENRMRFSILSNGTMVTAAMAEFLAATGRCDGVQVSIDGAQAAVHDSFRGPGSFARAMAGVRHLQDAGLSVSVRVTLHRRNIDDLPALARLLLEKWGLGGFSCNAASHLGLCREHGDTVQLTAEERTRAMAILTNLTQQYPDRIQATAGPLAEADFWREMTRARQQGRKSLPGGGHLTGCSGPMQTIAVRADGVLVPCIQLSHLELGRINRDGLLYVWQRHPILKRLRQRRNISLETFDFCRGCDFISYCTGNCPALAYTLTGDDQHPSPDACLRRFLERGGRLPE